MANLKKVKVRDVTLFWAFLDTPSEMSGAYQVDLAGLSPKQVDALEDMGIKVNNKDDDRGFYVTAKSKKYPIKAYDIDGDEIHDKVANGSMADVVIAPYAWEFKGKKGVGVGVSALSVTDLKIYNAMGGDDDIEEI